MGMKVLPTEEQVMFRDAARRWTEQEAKSGADMAAQWAQFAELGWLMVALPEDLGGLGGDVYDTAIIAEELGRSLVKAPYVGVAVTAAQVLLALAPERLEALASGEEIPLLAHVEAGQGGDPSWVETSAAQAGEGWVLTGTKTAILGAPLATGFLVSAKTADGKIALFEVAAGAAKLREYLYFDMRPAGDLVLGGTPATLIAPDALAAIEFAIDCEHVVESSEAVGVMNTAFELTRDYLNTRQQYGQLIGQFQALQHRLADMFIELEQARSVVLRGLDALVRGGPDRSAMAAACRVKVAQAGHFVGAQGIQLHGGIGVTEEYPVGHHFRQLIAFEMRHGGAGAQVERYAGMMDL
jgi:alkylation response protein AidB-like acyl-CoA dehydrogenase